MKKKPLLPLLLFIAIILQSCSAVGWVKFNVPVPPEVAVPEHIEHVGVVNRSLASQEKGGKTLNVVEGVLSGEGVHEDRNASIACVRGAEVQLNMDRLVTATLLDSANLTSAGTGVMPLPLTWDEVNRICSESGTDGLLVLEVFDSDQLGSVTNNAVTNLTTIAATGGKAPPPRPVTSNSRIFVKMAWRLYDNKEQMIIDEVRISDKFGVSSHPYDLGEFAKRDALEQSGYIAGRSYADRFLPGKVRLRRDMYKRKGPEMAMAWRSVVVNDWDEAIATWQSVADHPKRKVGGRACYNLAVAYEYKGDLNLAIEWAQKAYKQYGEKRAASYVRILRRRL